MIPALVGVEIAECVLVGVVLVGVVPVGVPPAARVLVVMRSGFLLAEPVNPVAETNRSPKQLII
jgi:hypothetical protein